ncbi:MAG: TetR family transcriptional regulator [Candidatus Hydrogenedentota bacterium]
MGRPRGFDIDKALDQALLVFWSKGFEATTLADLQKAMGINRPSLYAAFGNKEALFMKALDRYAKGPSGFAKEAMEEPTARAATERLLREITEAISARGNPQGCLVVRGLMTCEDASPELRAAVETQRKELETMLRRRYDKAKKEGELPPDTPAADLAKFVQTVIHGIAVQATSGTSRRDLQRIAAMAMQAWPGLGRTS